MAVRTVRHVTVKKLFRALMEAGDKKGQKVWISPTDTSQVKYLSAAQLEAHQKSGAVSIEEDVEVQEGALEPIGSAYVDVRPAKTAPAKNQKEG